MRRFSVGKNSRDTAGSNPPCSATQSSEWTVVGESFRLGKYEGKPWNEATAERPWRPARERARRAAATRKANRAKRDT
jgi:hypothetical protein